ncbi:MAG: hypothetical protein E6J83_17705 [Deltaproteobacteria bacterium]|nr:MAG: hypothetical protein E6J83_17705 [Deltaproteobacteria bacterium]
MCTRARSPRRASRRWSSSHAPTSSRCAAASRRPRAVRLSRALEATLALALREARRRRHEYLSIEHVFYALLHDAGVAEVLSACGVDVPRLEREMAAYLDQQVEQLPPGLDQPPQQTLGFQRILQRAAAHVQSSGKDEVDGRNVLVAIFREPDSHAAHVLAEHGVTRLDVITYLSHGIAKVPEAPAPGGGEEQDDDDDEEEGGARRARDPLSAFTVNLVERAAAGRIDPLIGRTRELERTVHVLCRRRKNNPIYVGDPGVGKTAIVEGFALRIHRGEVPAVLKDVAHHPRALPAAEEQPDLRGRPRGRENGHRRGLRPPRPRGARAGGAARRPGVRARHGGAARRHEVPRRVRGAAEGRHRGAQGAPRRDPLHRRDPHRRRGGGDARRLARRLEHLEARARLGRAPLHGRDDLPGLQEPLRARPCPRPPIPEDRSRRAFGRGDARHPARATHALRGTPSRDVHRRRAARRGRPRRQARP